MRDKIEVNKNSNVKGNRRIKENTYLKSKSKPRIKEIKKVNIDVDWRRRDSGGESERAVPSRSSVTWAEVAAKPKRMQARREPAKASTRSRLVSPASRSGNPPRVRVPRLAAVSIQCKNKEDYSKILSEAKQQIDLQEIGIKETTVGRSFSGSLMILLPRDDEKGKAPLLAEKLADLTRGQEGIRITVPCKKVEIKITQIDCSTEAQICEAVASIGGCLPTEIKVGGIRFSQKGNGSAVVQCPAKVANVSIGRVRLGWSVVKVDLMPAKINRCYRCWEPGHFLSNCKSDFDRSGSCFNCGESGHTAKECVVRASCLVCKHRNKPHEHQCGRPGCSVFAGTEVTGETLTQRKGTGRRPGPRYDLAPVKK